MARALEVRARAHLYGVFGVDAWDALEADVRAEMLHLRVAEGEGVDDALPDGFARQLRADNLLSGAMQSLSRKYAAIAQRLDDESSDAEMRKLQAELDEMGPLDPDADEAIDEQVNEWLSGLNLSDHDAASDSHLGTPRAKAASDPKTHDADVIRISTQAELDALPPDVKLEQESAPHALLTLEQSIALLATVADACAAFAQEDEELRNDASDRVAPLPPARTVARFGDGLVEADQASLLDEEDEPFPDRAITDASTLCLCALWAFLGVRPALPWTRDVVDRLAAADASRDAEEWDFVALGHASPPLEVQRALFWLQNARCFTRIRLWHVARNVALSVQFGRLVHLSRHVRGSEWAAQTGADARAWRSLRAWFDAQQDTLFPADATPAHWFMPAPGVQARAPHLADEVLNMATQAAAGYVDAKRTPHAQLRACMHRAMHTVLWELNDCSRRPRAERVSAPGVPIHRFAKRHARVQLAHLTVLDWRLEQCAEPGKYVFEALLRARRCAFDWLRAFMREGCACAR